MSFPYTIAKVQEYLIDEHHDRFQAVLKTCISDAKKLGTYRFEVTEETEPRALVITLTDIYWGAVGTIIMSTATNVQIRFQLTPPEDPASGEVHSFEPNLRAAIPLTIQSLEMLSIDDGYRGFLEHLRLELHQMRLASHRELKKWLWKSLKIYGYRCVTGRLSSNGTERRSWLMDPSPKKEYFKFEVKSTTARFAALARSLANTDEVQEAAPFTCELADPVTSHLLGNIVPELPKISVKLFQGEQTLDIIAGSTSADQIELQIKLLDEERHWRMWDRLRDQMEKHKLFTLTGVHSAVDTLNTECPERLARDSLRIGQNDKDGVKPTDAQDEEVSQVVISPEEFPDVGQNQLILDLWRQGLTAKEIGQRTRRQPKTILNLLSRWRREYGEELVPRRRT